MKEKVLNRLVSVKSIMTLVLTFVFAFLSVTGVISAEQFLTIFTVIVSFFFGSVSEKNKEGDKS